MTKTSRLVSILLASACLPAAAFAQSTPAPAPDQATSPANAAAATDPGAQADTTSQAPANGETSDTGTRLGDVVVTARKVSEKLTQVPLAITALTADRIDALGIRDVTQIDRFTPGLTFQNQSVGRNDRGFKQYIIRGIIPNSSLATRQTVTIFVDGAPVSGGNVSGVTDIERVEIIKGPQSAFFGRSTFAGAINITTRAPSYAWHGSADAEYARFNQHDLSASIEGGIIPDKLAFRLAARDYHTDGQYKDTNYPGTRLGERDTHSVSLSLLAEPTSTLRIRGFATYWEDDDGLPANGRFGAAQQNCALNPTSAARNYVCGEVGAPPASTITWNQNVIPTAYTAVQNGSTLFGPGFVNHLGLHRSAQQYRLTADQQIGGFTLSAIGSYGKNDWGFLQTALGVDYRNIPNPNATTRVNLPYIYSLTLGNTRDQDAYGEVRISSPQDRKLRFTLGGNYAWARTDNLTSSYQISGYVLNTPQTINSSNTYGIFGSVRWEFIRGVSISGEGRYQRDDLFQQTLSGTNPQFSQGFNSFSPRVVLQYEPNSNMALYASYSKGNRPGEFNTIYRAQPAYVQAIISQQANVNEAVGEDKIKMGEVGLKGTLLNNRVRVLLAGYVGRWTNRHIPNLIYYTDTGGILRNVQITADNGIVNLSGVEAELTVKATRSLTLEGTFDVADTNIRRTYSTDALAVTGNAMPVGTQLPFYPKYSASAAATYQRHAFSDFDGFTRVDVTYRSRVYESEADLASTRPAALVNLRLGVQNGKYRFELFGTNIFNNRTPTSLARTTETLYSAAGANTGTANGLTVSLADRATYGFRAGIKF